MRFYSKQKEGKATENNKHHTKETTNTTRENRNEDATATSMSGAVLPAGAAQPLAGAGGALRGLRARGQRQELPRHGPAGSSRASGGGRVVTSIDL